jgi:type II secretory pathway pseudopilin PulG
MKKWSRTLSSRARDARAEAGETLLEVLLALIILSLASVALITAFETSVNASAEHRNLSNFDTVLASSISTTSTAVQQQANSPFNNCLAVSQYPSSAQITAGVGVTGFTAAIAPSGSQPAVEYSDNGSYTTSCTSGTGGDVGNPQLINVVVTDTATGISQSNTVVVDNPTVIQTAGAVGSTANELVFITEPEGATVGNDFSTQPQLEVEDNGVIVTSDLSPITLTIGTGPAGASLSSTCSGQETAGIISYTGCSLNVIGTNYTLYASEPDPSLPGQDLTSSSTPFSVYPSQLATPSIVSALPSTTTVGGINVTFTGAPNAPTGQAYNLKICTDSAMSVGCEVVPNYVSGALVTTGLTSGTQYYVSITALPSTDYLGSTSPPAGPVLATVQLIAPTAVTVGYGPSAGTLSLSFTGSNGPPGQIYSVKACQNSGMSQNCMTNANVPTGGTITGLADTPGNPGITYYVQVTATASSGYLVSTPSVLTSLSNHADTSQVKTPSPFTLTSGPGTGAITVNYSEPNGGTAPTGYTLNVCTDAAMSMNCSSPSTGGPPGTQLTGLSAGTTYYVTVTAVASTQGFASATTAVASAVAPGQLAAPTGVSVGYGTVEGSIAVTFTGSSGAPSGQTYSLLVCTNNAMSAGCKPVNPNYTSGADFTGLAYTQGSPSTTPYWVQVTANASAGYLASSPSAAVSGVDTSQLNPPTNLVVNQKTNGNFTVTWTAPAGTAPLSYTGDVCTSQQMNGCTPVPFTSGSVFTNLPSGRYYVEITAVPPVGFASNFVETNGTTRVF